MNLTDSVEIDVGRINMKRKFRSWMVVVGNEILTGGQAEDQFDFTEFVSN